MADGEELFLSEENVEAVLADARAELGTMFGTTDENRAVGITGGVEFVELDGPSVVIALTGRFWHARPTVVARVANFLRARIPEVVDVVVSDPAMLLEHEGEGKGNGGPPDSAAAW